MLLIIDGIDGAGKTTLAEKLFDRVLELDHEYHGEPEYVCDMYRFPTRLPEGQEKADPLGRTLFHLKDFYEELQSGVSRENNRIYDRSFVSTLAYQGFESNSLRQHPTLYEAIMRLGPQAVLPRRFHHWDAKQVFFVNLTCDPREAVKRIGGRETDREDEIEEQEAREQLAYLTLLQKRLAVVYSDLKMRLHKFAPDHEYHFVELDSTHDETRYLVDALVDKVRPHVWPQQPRLC